MKIPIERSDDLRRGDLAHIQTTIGRLEGLPGIASCSRCQRNPGTHLIDTRSALPRVVCSACADEWTALTPMQRMRSRQDFATRGGR